MALYQHYIGIDIGKFTFTVNLYKNESAYEYQNSHIGFAKFIKDYNKILADSLCILEPTGGHEMNLACFLILQGIKVHRADARKVKNFILSFGTAAKTDPLDAKGLALYGYERHERLSLFDMPSQEHMELFQLVQRRSSLKAALVAEKNRLQSPYNEFIKDSIIELIDAINAQIKVITARIEEIINNNLILKQKREVLKTIPGVGAIVSFELLILLPELGSLCRRKIASLAGVAPRANDSGKHSGYRRTGHGRDGVKPILFIAAMAARNSNSYFREYYERLVGNGKQKKVALTAVMRKIITVANARIRDLEAS